MRKVNVIVVICGAKTNVASGVNEEVKIAQEEDIPYFLLYGRRSVKCVKPVTAKLSDEIYKWTWNNLKELIQGNR